MTVKSEGLGFCLEVESDEFRQFLRDLVNTEIDQISDITYDKDEEAEIKFEDSSLLHVVPSDLEDKDIHVHYVPGPDLENLEAWRELSSRIEDLTEGNNVKLTFFALSLRLDSPASEAIGTLGDFDGEIKPKGLELEKNSDTYSLYQHHDSTDTIITVRLNEPEYNSNLEDIKEKAADCINNLLDDLGEDYEA